MVTASPFGLLDCHHRQHRRRSYTRTGEATRTEVAGELAILDVEAFPPCRQWYAVHRKGKRLSRAAQTFLDYLQNEGEAEVAHLLTDVAVNSVEVG